MMKEDEGNNLNIQQIYEDKYIIDNIVVPVEYNIINIPSTVIPNENIEFYKYIKFEDNGTLESIYLNMWIHNESFKHPNIEHNKDACNDCQNYYREFFDTLVEFFDFITDTNSYIIDNIVKWLLFIDYHNDELFDELFNWATRTDNLSALYKVLRYVNKKYPYHFKMLGCYKTLIKKYLCENDLVDDYIEHLMDDHLLFGFDRTELNKRILLQEFYADKNLPDYYKLGIMI